jgi:hypothetical protein
MTNLSQNIALTKNLIRSSLPPARADQWEVSRDSAWGLRNFVGRHMYPILGESGGHKTNVKYVITSSDFQVPHAEVQIPRSVFLCILFRLVHFHCKIIQRGTISLFFGQYVPYTYH